VYVRVSVMAVPTPATSLKSEDVVVSFALYLHINVVERGSDGCGRTRSQRRLNILLTVV
jgi:hypothetical protein